MDTSLAKNLVGDRLSQVKESLLLFASIDSENDFEPGMQVYLEHTLSTEGKLIRPLFNLLSCAIFGYGKATDKQVINLATAIEILHIATLVHDDIIDGAKLRRNRPTVSAKWGNKVAILVGDYLFASALELACTSKYNSIVESTSKTVKDLSYGELRESTGKDVVSKTKDDYLKTIRLKTASLFGSSTECGAILGGASNKQYGALKEFGIEFGMAFQIEDDVLDFESHEAQLKKPTMHDLKGGVVTLPLIVALKRGLKKDLLENYLASANKDQLLEIKEFVLSSGSLDECRLMAKKRLKKANLALSILPSCPELDALCQIANSLAN